MMWPKSPICVPLSPPDLLALTCHCGNFGQEVCGEPSGGMVNVECLFDRGRLTGHTLAGRRVKGRLHQGRNTTESQTSTDEFVNGDLVRRIEHRRCGPAGSERPPGDRKRRKSL